jgi:peptidoglycan hydrolase-like protein with peptidoglycan-binding domain
MLKRDTGVTYNSLYRGEDAKELLHKHGKHTQGELVEILHGQGVNPADRGSHILLGDGTEGALHERLEPMRCGIDVNDDKILQFIKAGPRRGIHLKQTYPNSRKEFHHANAVSWDRYPTLFPGDRGKSVKLLARRLHFVLDKEDHKPYDARGARTVFDEGLRAALEHFQLEHGLQHDGTFGPKSYEALESAVKFRKAHPVEAHA